MCSDSSDVSEAKWRKTCICSDILDFADFLDISQTPWGNPGNLKKSIQEIREIRAYAGFVPSSH